MADDAIAYDGIVTARFEDIEADPRFYVRLGRDWVGGTLTVPVSDLPSARVGDKVQVALFLRPEVADGE